MASSPLTLSSRTEADAAQEAVTLVRAALGSLDHAEMLLRKAAEKHDRFTGLWAIVADAIGDIQPSEREVTEALQIDDAARAYGERVRYAAPVHGAGL